MPKSTKRFDRPPIETTELAPYTSNPYQTYVNGLHYFHGTGVKGDIVIRPNDEILIGKGGPSALNVYSRLLNDSTVQSAFSKLIQEMTSRELVVKAASDSAGDLAIAEFVEKVLKEGDLDMDEIYRSLAESYITGIRIGEVIWQKGKSIVPVNFKTKDTRRFRFVETDKGITELRLIENLNETELLRLPPRKIIFQRYWTNHDGDPYGSGLGRILYSLVKFKRRAIESELLYSDRFATPTAVGTAPLSATINEVNQLHDRLASLSQEVAMVIPEGYKLDFVSPNGHPDIFSGIRDYLAKEITTLIAGESEAGNPDAGARASSEVANDVRQVKSKEISELISSTLNRTLIRWIVDANYGVKVKSPTIYRDFSPESSSELSITDVVALVEKLSLRPTQEWIERTYMVEFEEPETDSKEGEDKEPSIEELMSQI